MNTTDVQGTLREMWETRPARPREDRQVAGVAAAIARRYDIDPVLVRIGFVVAAFFGVGAALYIAGWILLPEAAADPTAPEPARRPRKIVLVGLVVATIASVGSVFGNHGNVLLPALAVALLLFLLHRSRGARGPVVVAAAAPAPAAADAPTVATGPSLVKEQVPAQEPVSPPAWDPLGAAPFAWDLPEPAPATEPDPPRRRRRPVTSVTLGVALLAVGTTALVGLVVGSLSLATLPVLLGVALAVLGAGLVVGAFLRSGRGLIPIALVLSALTWAVVAAPLDRWQGNGFGDIAAAPTTLAELQPGYRRTAGDITLDLTRLDLAGVTGGNPDAVHTSVSLGAGDVSVRVAPDTDVVLAGSAGIGDVRFDDREVSGPGSRLDVTDLGADGVASGRRLVLDLSTGAGSVEVRRG